MGKASGSEASATRVTPPVEEFDRQARYLTIGGAAELLGVSISTLRNWDRAGKLLALRHPINGYRLYERAALERWTPKSFRREPPPPTHERTSARLGNP